MVITYANFLNVTTRDTHPSGMLTEIIRKPVDYHSISSSPSIILTSGYNK